MLTGLESGFLKKPFIIILLYFNFFENSNKGKTLIQG